MWIVMLLTVLITICTFAQEAISFNGLVVDENDQPIPGAVITFNKNPGIILTSDANGLISTGIVTSDSKHRRGPVIAAFSGNELFVAAGIGPIVSVELFNAKGQRFFSRAVNHLEKKAALLSLTDIATGIYVLKVTVGDKIAVFNGIFKSDQKITVRYFALTPSSSSRTVAKKKAAAIDEVLALADGYLLGSTPITSYDETDVKIICTTSNQWQPTPEELEHEGCMVKIRAAGTKFSMGQPAFVAADLYEQPVHTVSFTYDYWIDTTEVTQKQFNDVMTEVYPDFNGPWNEKYGVGDNIACYHVNEFDAVLYCNALSKKQNLDTVYSFEGFKGTAGELCSLFVITTNYNAAGYRLPTDAEFEYACRGGCTADYYWGKMFRPYPETPDDTAEISEYALWNINAFYTLDDTQFGLHQGVASKIPNNYGLYDMLGSLSEWFQLAYQPYTEEDRTDPKPPADAFGVSSRGGNWGNAAKYIRSACRKLVVADYPYWNTGFRTVREVKE
jgi:formylglycine-generating enzyme required for sulfatase activity